ncbi:MAG: TatD family hydrolase [Rikenellaceae bacterium]
MEYTYVNIHTHNENDEASPITTVGIHPWSAEQHNLKDPQIKKLFEQDLSSADAVGEIGLDFAAEVDRESQKELFVIQLKLAKKHKKPIILHCVKAFEPTMQILSTFPIQGVIFHGFIGSAQQMNQAVERGYYMSFGERTFASPKTLKALRECPLDRLLLETDTANISIEEIYERVTKYRIEELDELKKAIYENYKRIFPKI